MAGQAGGKAKASHRTQGPALVLTSTLNKPRLASFGATMEELRPVAIIWVPGTGVNWERSAERARRYSKPGTERK